MAGDSGVLLSSVLFFQRLSIVNRGARVGGAEVRGTDVDIRAFVCVSKKRDAKECEPDRGGLARAALLCVWLAAGRVFRAVVAVSGPVGVLVRASFSQESSSFFMMRLGAKMAARFEEMYWYM